MPAKAKQNHIVPTVHNVSAITGEGSSQEDRPTEVIFSGKMFNEFFKYLLLYVFSQDLILNEMEKHDICSINDSVLDYVAAATASSVDQQLLQQQQQVDVNQHQVELMAHDRNC